MNAIEEKIWKCQTCGTRYIAKVYADKCCTEKPKKVCEDCGKELDPKSYRTVCDSCSEKRHYNRCRKMTIAEYEREFPGNMVIVGDDNLYSSVEDALESLCEEDYEEFPHYVYGTKKLRIGVDIDSAVESALEECYEGAEFSNLNKLYKFVDEWNKENSIEVFEEAKIVIDIPDEIRAEYVTK